MTPPRWRKPPTPACSARSYREATPTLAAGSSIARNPKPGSECVLYGRVTDAAGKPVANATVSIWQTGADGLYDIQASATSVDYRGVFATDADGVYVLRTVKPLGYSIPMDGPVGAMVKAQARHGMRPAHIHFLVGASGYRELVTALYLRDDPHLADDVVFGSSGDLAVDVVANDPDCPIKGMPSIRFDMQPSRESAGRQDQRARRRRSVGDHEAIGQKRSRAGGSRIVPVWHRPNRSDRAEIRRSRND